MTKEFDVTIDKFRLDQEWERQPEFYHEYALQLADARRDWDEAKNTLEVVKAELHQKISAHPDQYEVIKPTVDAVNNAIVLQQEHKDATADVISAKHRVNVLEAAVAALDQRKRALEKLVDLHLSDYYAKPVTRKEFAEQTEERKKVESRRRTRLRRNQEDE